MRKILTFTIFIIMFLFSITTLTQAESLHKRIEKKIKKLPRPPVISTNISQRRNYNRSNNHRSFGYRNNRYHSYRRYECYHYNSYRVVDRIWVRPVYEERWVPGYYCKYNGWIPGSYQRVLLREGYWIERNF